LALEPTIEVEGIDDFIETIDRMIEGMHPIKIEPELKKGAQTVAAEMRKRAPVRKQESHNRGGLGSKKAPGVLKRAIKTKQLKRYGRDPAPFIAAIDRKPAPHAWLVVHGTSGARKVDPPRRVIIGGQAAFITHTGVMPPNRFVDDAYNATKDGVLNHIEKAVGNLLEEAME
jgi:HK97 gp10 family phage protein